MNTVLPPFFWDGHDLAAPLPARRLTLSGLVGEIPQAAAQAVAWAGHGSFLRWWWFLRDIKKDYNELNVSRAAALREKGIVLPPPSTGVEVPLPSTIDFRLEAVAIPADEIYILRSSPVQNSAEEYGSSFARAAVWRTGKDWWISVSGTATITKEGESIPGTVDEQAASIRELYDSMFSGWNAVLLQRKWWGIPTIKTSPDEFSNAVLCRPDLLLEAEALGYLPNGWKAT